MIASGVACEHIDQIWPQLWQMLQPAYEGSDEQPGEWAVCSGIKNHNLQAWAVFDRNELVAGILTKLLREATSGELQCHLWLISGSHLSLWADDFLAKLIPWAKAEGCCAITTSSKRGWHRRPARFGFERIEDRGGFPTWKRAI